jgi:hypothetical protein
VTGPRRPPPGGFGSFGHLALRFAGSLSPAAPSVAGEAWAQRWLSAGERDLWARQSNPDRRHAIEVAHTVAALLGDRDGAGVPTEVIAAALLHDVGKIESGLGTFGRVAATVAAMIRGRAAVAAWASNDAEPPDGPSSPRWRRRAGRYVTHDQRGGLLLAQAGSAPFVVTWAREHHQPEDTWTLDPTLTAALKVADGD